MPQGGPVSPVLSNIYLHYVLDLWFERRFKKSCRGYAELTRFADDFVAVFWNDDEALRFRREMGERLAAFGLRVAPEKTALLNFDASLLQCGPAFWPFALCSSCRCRECSGRVGFRGCLLAPDHDGGRPPDRDAALMVGRCCSGETPTA